MYVYVLTSVLAWLVYKTVCQVWGMREKRRLFHAIPDLPGRHWFWGYVHLFKSFDDMVNLMGDYVAKARPPLVTTWMMFFFPTLTLVNPRAIKEVLTAQNVPKNMGIAGPYRFLKPWLGDGLLVSAGKKWERNRRLLTPAFHFDILRTYIGMFNCVSDIFVNRVKETAASGTSFNVYPMVSRATLDTMLRSTLSYEDDTVQNRESQHPYVEAVSKISFLFAERVVNPLCFFDFIYKLTANGREFKKTTDYVHQFASEIIETRREALAGDQSKLDKKRLDLLDTLLTARDEEGNGLTDQEIRDEVDTFMFEGHDTTASAISWALHALAKHPEIQHKVRDEAETVYRGRHHLEIWPSRFPLRLCDDRKIILLNEDYFEIRKRKEDDLAQLHYTTYFIKEVLRFYSPVPYTQRRLVEPLKVQGITFQPGQQIDLFHHVVHRNPEIWKDPEEFRPDRFLPDNIVKQDPFAFTAFSAGPRNCIGQNFAMNEIKIFITKMVLRFKITPDANRDAVLYAEIVMRAKDGIYLNFEEI